MAVEAFGTLLGVRVPAITSEQMAEVDRIASQETGPNLYQMMENAGRSLAMAVIERLGTHAKRVVVAAGTGGNGGGGICAARHLANHGVDVGLVLADEDRLGEVARQQLAVYRASQGEVLAPGDLEGVGGHIGVDALVGYRLGGELQGVFRDLVLFLNDRCEQVAALDVPSGIDATTGEPTGPHVDATVTVTLALPKTGLDAPAVGRLELADIGIPKQVYRRAGIAVPDSMFGLGYRVRISPV